MPEHSISSCPVWKNVQILLDAGFQTIIPIAIGDKKTVVKWKPYQYKGSFPTREDHRGWYQYRFWNHNYCVFSGEPSGVFIFDCDDPEMFERLCARFPNNPFAVKSHRGGHFYFRIPEGVNQRCMRNSVHAEVHIPDPDQPDRYIDIECDFRGQGGYVIGPLSTHKSGAIYTPKKWPWTIEDRTLMPELDMEWTIWSGEDDYEQEEITDV